MCEVLNEIMGPDITEALRKYIPVCPPSPSKPNFGPVSTVNTPEGPMVVAVFECDNPNRVCIWPRRCVHGMINETRSPLKRYNDPAPLLPQT